jgi:hypothetical protein
MKNTRFGDYTAEEKKALDDAQIAARTLAKSFDVWMVLARGVEAAYQRAARNDPNSKNSDKTAMAILEEHDIAPYLGHTFSSRKTNASKLRKILERLPEVEAWRARLSPHQQLQWGAPSTIYQRCPAFLSEKFATKRRERTIKSGTKVDPLTKAADENMALRTELNNEKRKAEEFACRNRELNEELDTFKQKAREASADFNTFGALTAYVDAAFDSGQVSASSSEVAPFLAAFIRRVGPSSGHQSQILCTIAHELGFTISFESPSKSSKAEAKAKPSKAKASKPKRPRGSNRQVSKEARDIEAEQEPKPAAE